MAAKGAEVEYSARLGTHPGILLTLPNQEDPVESFPGLYATNTVVIVTSGPMEGYITVPRSGYQIWPSGISSRGEYIGGSFLGSHEYAIKSYKEIVFDPESLQFFEAQEPNERAVLSLESSLRRQPELIRRIEDLFAAGEGEIFEAGEESEFSKGLVEVVKQYGAEAVKVVDNLILGNRTHPTVAAEALCVLGDLDDTATYESRSLLLTKSVGSKSSRIREGAILGLCHTNDYRSITALKGAYASEPYAFLREYIEQVLQILEEHVREET